MNRFERHPKATLAVLIALGAVLVLAATELALRAVGGVPTDGPGPGRFIEFSEWPPNQRLTMQAPSLRLAAGDRVQATYPLDTDADGFILPARVHARPDATVLFVGGSTTETMYVAPERRWVPLSGRLIERAGGPAVNTLNGGHFGNTVVHANLVFIGKGVAQRPDVVVLMEAINDLNTLLRIGGYWNDDRFVAVVRRHPQSVSRGLRMIVESTIPETDRALRRARQVLSRLFGMQAQAGTGDAVAQAPARADETPQQALGRMLPEYEGALRWFVSTARAWRIVPVLMTQPLIQPPASAGADREGMLAPARLLERGLRFDDVAAYHARFNDAVRRVAAETGTPLIDLARELPQDAALFYDGLHYTDSGSEAVAAIVARELARILPARRSPQGRR